jgi:hypothetical protein
MAVVVVVVAVVAVVIHVVEVVRVVVVVVEEEVVVFRLAWQLTAVRSRPLTRIVVGSIQRRVSLGGWSDWARIGSVEAANDLAKLVGKLVLYTFADGVDLDFEHLSPFVNAFPGDNEIEYVAPLPLAKIALC